MSMRWETSGMLRQVEFLFQFVNWSGKLVSAEIDLPSLWGSPTRLSCIFSLPYWTFDKLEAVSILNHFISNCESYWIEFPFLPLLFFIFASLPSESQLRGRKAMQIERREKFSIETKKFQFRSKSFENEKSSSRFTSENDFILSPQHC